MHGCVSGKSRLSWAWRFSENYWCRGGEMGVFFPIIYDIRGTMYDVLYLPRFFFYWGCG